MKRILLIACLSLIHVNGWAGTKAPKTITIDPNTMLDSSGQQTKTTTTPQKSPSSGNMIIDAGGNLKMMAPTNAAPQTNTPPPSATQMPPSTPNDSTKVTPGMMRGGVPSSSSTTTAPPTRSVARPPQPLYGTVGGASVLQQTPARPVPENIGSVMTTPESRAAIPDPAPTTPGRPIGTARPIIPIQPNAQ